MQGKIEYVDANYARVLLATQTTNRPLSLMTVSKYADDMREGRWVTTGQTIQMDEDGKLIDGQHRLNAVIESVTNQPFMIVRGVSRDAFKVIDGGKMRRLSDVLAIEGHKNVLTLAATARQAYNYAAGVSITHTPNKAALEAFVGKHPYLHQAVLQVGSANKGAPLPISAMGAVVFLANEGGRYDPEVGEFIDGVRHGVALAKGDPRLTLRNWYMAQRATKVASMTTAAAFAGVVKAWNAYARGETMESMRIPAVVNQDSLKVAGYRHDLYSDVPDLKERREETRYGGKLNPAPPKGAMPPQSGVRGPRGRFMPIKEAAERLLEMQADSPLRKNPK